MMTKVIQPPTSLDGVDRTRSVFLAGSIEMGGADDWQSTVTRALSDCDLTILNPRRDAWDASWEQSMENPLFREQVEWELAALELATMIVMYFSPATKSPITLLELGLFARSGKLTVCCPDGFWRKGNVEVVCAKYGVSMVESLDALVESVDRSLH